MALLGIIVAHVNPSDLVIQLRSFDVPMMAFLSGASYYLSSSGKEITYKQYVGKRLKKLVLPTYLFLTLFFVGTFLLSFILKDAYYFDMKDIIYSYALFSGIGYVWIVWIFLAIALINPLLLRLNRKIHNSYVYIFVLLVVYGLYVGVCSGYKLILPRRFAMFFEHYILYAIGYGLIAALGIRIYKLTKRNIGMIGLICIGIYLCIAFNKNFELTGHYKYPPTTYYFSYALGLIMFMWLLLDVKPLIQILNNKFVCFLSENSFWIYLWHIIPVYAIGKFGGSGIFAYAIGRFLFVLLVTIVITLAQNNIIVILKKIGYRKED